MDSHSKRIQMLIQKLGHPDPNICRWALWELAAAGDLHSLLIEAPHWPSPAEDAVGALCEALRDPNRQVCRASAAILGAIAERHPTPALRAALPRLRQLASRWFVDYDYLDYVELLTLWLPEHETARLLYRNALGRIESATAAQKDLPLPATAPRPSPQELPVPAAPPARGSHSLPIPADLAAPRCADGGSGRSGHSVWRSSLRSWRSRFQGLLRRRGSTG
jgi:HEAT repeats